MPSPHTRVQEEIKGTVAKLKRLATIDKAAGTLARVSKVDRLIDELLEEVANA